MAQQDVYRELSKKLLMENSFVVRKIWTLVCSEKEARIVNSLPATLDELCAKFGAEKDEMLGIMQGLFHKGAVFEAVKNGAAIYRMPRHVVQFHDSNILWDEAPDELMALWEEFGETDYPALLSFVTEAKLPSFMRVIPIGEAISAKNQVLAQEDAIRMLESASDIAVTTCVCRKLLKRCKGPLEVCLQINRGAEYTIKRGTGRRVSLGEAEAILKQAQAAGLVAMTENTGGRSNAICNCCSCCCEMLKFARDTKTKGVLAPSRYRAVLDEGSCTGCLMCEDICPMEVIRARDDGKARMETEACIGCGLCANVCPTGAIALATERPPEFIPG